jgi:electron transport complex protein RnfC
MIDYSKFVLKPKEEIILQLKDVDKIFLIGCNKCFKEFKQFGEEEKECVELIKMLRENGKKVLGCADIDFLCNRIITEKIIGKRKELNQADCILVNSCGIGVQTIAELTEGTIPSKPVFTAADSIPQGGQHCLSLYDEEGIHFRCAACGQCFLGLTAGICPIVNCAKELVNGPCGGAKNGKCEIASAIGQVAGATGKDKDCAWEKIYQRLNLLSSEQRVASSETVIRDYTKPSLKTKNVITDLVREKRFEGFYGGVYPLEKKEFTSQKAIKIIPEHKQVVIPLLQHTGCPAEPLVKSGDKVFVGHKIGQSKGFISANIHSSISGKVIAVEPRSHPVCPDKILSVIIENDGKNQLSPEIKSKPALENLSPEEIREIVHEAGIVGLGGAMFPTQVKLCPPKDKKIDTFILNGAECEPYLTADERVMIEKTEDIIFGMKALMKVLNVGKGYIAIEENKPEAIAKLRAKSEENIEVVVVKTKYPQGAERMLIKRILQREVPLGGLPLDVGVVVNNVSTAVAVAEAIKTGLPLIKRVITVTGEKIKDPQNLEVKIGTSFKDLIDYCGGVIDGEMEQGTCLLKMGGPMMGIVQKDFNVPVIKGTTGILVTSPSDIEFTLLRACIKCGRCLDVCPMELNPSNLGLYAEKENWEKMHSEGVLNCIECGSCNYICPSKRSLVEVFKLAKKEICAKLVKNPQSSE